jgi:hypothetical protein
VGNGSESIGKEFQKQLMSFFGTGGECLAIIADETGGAVRGLQNASRQVFRAALRRGTPLAK